MDSALAPIGSMSSREIILQDILMARAACGGNDIRRSLGGETALRSEIEMLEQTRRSIVMQQQRLQMLIDQSQTASSNIHLSQLAAAYESVTGLGSLRDRSFCYSAIGDLERRATEIAGRVVQVRGLNQRLSLGGRLI